VAGARRHGLVLGVGLLVCVAIAACGDEEPTDRRGPDAAGVDAAAATVERFRAPPRFSAPGPAFDARRALQGKLIYEIPITSEVPFVAAVEAGMRQAADEVGATLEVFPNQGDPSQWAQGIRAAIASDADAILLLAQDPELVRPQVEQAEAAGIPVVVLRTTGEGERCPETGTTCVPGPFEQAGRLEADFVIADSGGEANVLVITSNDAPSTGALVHGLRQEFARRCAACDLRFVDVPIPDWASKLRSEVQSALVRDPMIDYVIPIYDSMSQFAVPAIVAAGASERIKIATFNGTPFVLEMLQDEEVVAMDAGENLAWVGWAAMDQAFRAIAGERPVRSERTPLRVFDAANAREAGTPPRFDRGYGQAYVDGYRRLWGLPE
jgi:ribose transport system substrate-binding protein